MKKATKLLYITSPGYRHKGFVATHVLGHMMCGDKMLVPMNQSVLNKSTTRTSVHHKPKFMS